MLCHENILPKTRERNKENDEKTTKRTKHAEAKRVRKTGPEDGRSEGAAWGNTPERAAAAASSRETETDQTF